MPSQKPVEVNDLGWDEIRKRVLDIRARGFYVKVGVLAEEENRKKSEEGGAITNVALAEIHEFGKGVPERPFMRSTFDRNAKSYLSGLGTVAKEIYKPVGDPNRKMNLFGARVRADIVKTIDNTIDLKPLSPKYKRRPSGAEVTEASRPLVDTGQLKNSITWQIVRGDPS